MRPSSASTVPVPDVTSDWRRWSLCAQGSPDDFFPVGEGPAARAQAERAKRICHRCPVEEQCRTWALDEGLRHGVFGGLDDAERVRAARDREKGRAA